MTTFRWFFVASLRVLSALMIFVLISAFFNNTSNQTTNMIITLFLAIFWGGFSCYYDRLVKKIAPKKKHRESI